jgi:hypothetical protein
MFSLMLEDFTLFPHSLVELTIFSSYSPKFPTSPHHIIALQWKPGEGYYPPVL